MNYPEEVLDPDEDDGTMVGSRQSLEAAVIGHKIIEVKKTTLASHLSWAQNDDGLLITLDNGVKVWAAEMGDCCAYTEIDPMSILNHIDQIDHVITGVGTTDGFKTWHIYADLGDVLEFKVEWSCGNPFYYGYGFNVTVFSADEDLPEIKAITS